MKAVFYYLRNCEKKENKKGQEINDIKKAVTVAVIEIEGRVARGIAICSPSDQFSHKGVEGGRSRAIGRALRALNKEKTTGRINRPEACQVLDSCSDQVDFTHKSVFMPELTVYEKSILERADNMGVDQFHEYLTDLTLRKPSGSVLINIEE